MWCADGRTRCCTDKHHIPENKSIDAPGFIPLGGGGMDDAAASLLDKYGWDDPIINDPDSISRKGWELKQKYYWNEKNVRLNLIRFEPVLVRAMQLLKD
jgi:hypothetical protein